MKVISTGNTYEIFDDTLCTYDSLPPQTYILEFNDFKGFLLKKYGEIEIKENKIYGSHVDKVNKVLRSYKKFDRNLGVIMSGDKGTGKSLFAKLLSVEAVNRGIPVIIVDKYYPGIVSFIESVEQEVMVLFDEFDKTFQGHQSELLSLFDGISTGKKMFVITCNDIHLLNDFLINRPGRFHYHFRFDYPHSDEVRVYLHDKLPAEFYGEIDEVVSFSNKVNLNYDCLRAIAFELGMGETFKNAIRDLNVINDYSIVKKCSVSLCFHNGTKIKEEHEYIDFFDEEEQSVSFIDDMGHEIAEVKFLISKALFNIERSEYVIKAQDLTIDYYNSIFDPDNIDARLKESIESAKATGVDSLIITCLPVKDNIHYRL